MSVAAAFFRGLYAIVKSALTGPDGVSWSPGRIMGFSTFAVGLCAYIRVTATMLPKLQNVADATNFLQGSAVYFGGLGVACTALVLGMAPTDAGGGFWKAAAPEKAP